MDYYNVLGVPKEATREDIRAAFKRLVLTHHPDRAIINNTSLPPASPNKDFSLIREAHEFLQDDEKRRILDEYGDVGVFLYKLFEQQPQDNSDEDLKKNLDAEINSGKKPSIADQVEALLAWHGIRLHAFLLGTCCLCISLLLISKAFSVLTQFAPLLLLLPNLTIQSMVLWHSKSDRQSLIVLLILLLIVDTIQALLYFKVNYFLSILAPIVVIQGIFIIFGGFEKWYQPVGTILSVCLLCVVWNGIVFLPYPLLLLPLFLTRLPTATDMSPIQIAIASVLFLALSSALHLPYWVTLIIPIILLCICFIFLSILVPLGHYYIIRMIMAHLREQNASPIVGLITVS